MFLRQHRRLPLLLMLTLLYKMTQIPVRRLRVQVMHQLKCRFANCDGCLFRFSLLVSLNVVTDGAKGTNHLVLGLILCIGPFMPFMMIVRVFAVWFSARRASSSACRARGVDPLELI